MRTPLWAQRQEAQTAPACRRGVQQALLHPSICWVSDGLKPSFPASHFHPRCFCISPGRILPCLLCGSKPPPKFNHAKNVNPWEATIPFSAPLTSFPRTCAPSSLLTGYLRGANDVQEDDVFVGFLVPRLPAQEAVLFAGMLNPLACCSVHSNRCFHLSGICKLYSKRGERLYIIILRNSISPMMRGKGASTVASNKLTNVRVDVNSSKRRLP